MRQCSVYFMSSVRVFHACVVFFLTLWLVPYNCKMQTFVNIVLCTFCQSWHHIHLVSIWLMTKLSWRIVLDLGHSWNKHLNVIFLKVHKVYYALIDFINYMLQNLIFSYIYWFHWSWTELSKGLISKYNHRSVDNLILWQPDNFRSNIAF